MHGKKSWTDQYYDRILYLLLILPSAVKKHAVQPNPTLMGGTRVQGRVVVSAEIIEREIRLVAW